MKSENKSKIQQAVPITHNCHIWTLIDQIWHNVENDTIRKIRIIADSELNTKLENTIWKEIRDKIKNQVISQTQYI